MAVREALVIMVKGLVVSGRVKTNPWVKVACKILNAVLHLGIQSHFASFLVKSWRGWVIVEKLGMNFQ